MPAIDAGPGMALEGERVRPRRAPGVAFAQSPCWVVFFTTERLPITEGGFEP